MRKRTWRPRWTSSLPSSRTLGEDIAGARNLIANTETGILKANQPRLRMRSSRRRGRSAPNHPRVKFGAMKSNAGACAAMGILLRLLKIPRSPRLMPSLVRGRRMEILLASAKLRMSSVLWQSTFLHTSEAERVSDFLFDAVRMSWVSRQSQLFVRVNR